MFGHRVVLARGKQRKLIEHAKSGFNSWGEFARYLGINEHYLSYDLRNEIRTLDERMYKRMCSLSGKNYDNKIIRRLDGNWGRKKGARLSPRTKAKQVKIIRPSPELAEIIGIVLGDGNIYRKQYALRICGNLLDEKEYLTVHVRGLITKVFGVEPKVYYHRRMNEIIIYVYSKFIVKNLEYYGVRHGNKMKNNVRIPEWVMCEKRYVIPCIRGLLDTDGCVFRAKGKVRIEFYSAIPNLRKSFYSAMKNLGFSSSWRSSKRSTKTYGLYSGRDVKMFINNIGFNNPKYKLRARVV